MRIGIDGACWANARGYGRFARELLARMVRLAPDDDFLFFLDPAARAQFRQGVEVLALPGPQLDRREAQRDGLLDPLEQGQLAPPHLDVHGEARVCCPARQRRSSLDR